MLRRLIQLLTRACLFGGVFVALAHGAESAQDQPPAMFPILNRSSRAALRSPTLED